MSSIAPITDARRYAAHPAFQLGFRPFYLLAGMFAVVSVPVWIATLLGYLHPGGYLQGIAWHSHEMVFGFATAVIAGFLLTAVRNWTGLSTPVGLPLAGLAALWLAGRVLIFTGPAPLAVLVDSAFIPLLAVAIAIPILRSGNTGNLKILAVLAGLAVANILFHLSYRNLIATENMRSAVTTALDVIAILIAVIGGRVIPSFIGNAIATAQPRRIRGIEFISIGSLMLVLLADSISGWYALPSSAWIGLLVAAALGHASRLILWQPHKTRHDTLLLMLPVAYAWIPISLALRAFSHIEVVAPAASVHGLTLGAMGGLMVAMMMRSALGHTGRPLRAGRAENGVFLLVQLAALARVGAVFAGSAHYVGAIVVSTLLWVAAFVLFLLRYWPILTKPRIDGRPG